MTVEIQKVSPKKITYTKGTSLLKVDWKCDNGHTHDGFFKRHHYDHMSLEDYSKEEIEYIKDNAGDEIIFIVVPPKNPKENDCVTKTEMIKNSSSFLDEEWIDKLNTYRKEEI